MLQALFRRSSKVFGKKYAVFVTAEFDIFWHGTTTMENLDFNLICFRYNLLLYFEAKKVDIFMEYFYKQFVHKRGISTYNWLHIGDKEKPFYDATNNTSETLNKVLKQFKRLPLDTWETVKVLNNSLDKYLEFYHNYDVKHNYKYSVNNLNKRYLQRKILRKYRIQRLIGDYEERMEYKK